MPIPNLPSPHLTSEENVFGEVEDGAEDYTESGAQSKDHDADYENDAGCPPEFESRGAENDANSEEDGAGSLEEIVGEDDGSRDFTESVVLAPFRRFLANRRRTGSDARGRKDRRRRCNHLGKITNGTVCV